MKFTDILKKALPWIGAAATGGAPALVAMAAKEVSSALGMEVKPDPEAIGEAVANATPEQMIRLREGEQAFKVRMTELGFQNEQELARVYVGDVQDARKAHAGDRGVFWLGISVLLTFAAVMALALAGAYQLLTGGIQVKDVGVVAAIFGFLGTVVGYVAGNAQQVVSYFFGSSRGSKEKADAMAQAFKGLRAG